MHANDATKGIGPYLMVLSGFLFVTGGAWFIFMVGANNIVQDRLILFEVLVDTPRDPSSLMAQGILSSCVIETLNYAYIKHLVLSDFYLSYSYTPC